MNKFLYNLVYQNRLDKYNLFIEQFRPGKETRILDVGASDMESLDYANLLEKKYPYPGNITVLGIETYGKEFSRRYPRVKTVSYNGGLFPFGDKEFDICWTSAVIEHVGGVEKQIQFLREVNRVAKSCFITTPNKYFPVEVHTRLLFLHWLPKKYFDAALRKIGKSWASGDYMHPMSVRGLKKLLRKSGINNYRIITNRKFGLTVDLLVIIRALPLP